MNQLITKLSALLILQVVIFAALYWYGKDDSGAFQSKPLFEISSKDVTKIEIVDGTDAVNNLTSEKPNDQSSDNNNSITLIRSDSQWQLSNKSNLPVDEQKITSVIEQLTKLQSTWPTATTSNSHNRFEVSRDKYQRKIKLYKGDKLLNEIYLGTSPGFRQVHLRKKDADNVYSVKLNTFDFPVNSNDWLDKSLLSAKSINNIQSENFKLIQDGENWQLDNDTQADLENKVLNEEKVKSLVDQLTFLNVLSVAENVELTETKTLTVSNDDKSFEYQLSKKEQDYLIKRNDIDAVFKISQSDYEKLADISLDDLIVETALQDKSASDIPTSEDDSSDEKSTDMQQAFNETEESQTPTALPHSNVEKN